MLPWRCGVGTGCQWLRGVARGARGHVEPRAARRKHAARVVVEALEEALADVAAPVADDERVACALGVAAGGEGAVLDLAVVQHIRRLVVEARTVVCGWCHFGQTGQGWTHVGGVVAAPEGYSGRKAHRPPQQQPQSLQQSRASTGGPRLKQAHRYRHLRRSHSCMQGGCCGCVCSS